MNKILFFHELSLFFTHFQKTKNLQLVNTVPGEEEEEEEAEEDGPKRAGTARPSRTEDRRNPH
jgi:hypothetical protein